MQKLLIWVVGPTVVGFAGQLIGEPFGYGLAGGILGSIAGLFVGWWAYQRWFR